MSLPKKKAAKQGLFTEAMNAQRAPQGRKFQSRREGRTYGTAGSGTASLQAFKSNKTIREPKARRKPYLSRQQEEMHNVLRDEVFGRDVVIKLRRLWQRVADGNKISEEEEQLILEEISSYQEVCQYKLLKHRRNVTFFVPLCDKYVRKYYESKLPPDVTAVKSTHQERKQQSERRRALFWQSLLEILNEVSDLLLLQDLLENEPNLFYASVSVLLAAFVGKIITAIFMWRRVDKQYVKWYLLGVAISGFETNLGLHTIKKCLKEVEKNNRSHFDWVELKRVLDERDSVMTSAQNQLLAGKAEMFFILCVTIIQDLPEFAIQIMYIDRRRQELDYFFWFAAVTTWLHFIFQTWEFNITRRSVRGVLPPIAYGREKKYDGDDEHLNKKLDKLTRKYKLGVRTLDLANCNQINRASIASIGKHCKNLTELNLDYCKYIGGEGHRRINLKPLSQCKHLEIVSLRFTRVTDDEIERFAKKAKKMISINLSHCEAITNRSALALASFCRYLETVGLTDTMVTDTGIAALASQCWNLKTALFSNSAIEDQRLSFTDNAMSKLSAGAWRMVWLNVGATSFDDGMLHDIAHGCNLLRIIHLNSTQVTDEGIKILCEQCNDLRMINLNSTSVRTEGIESISLNCKKLNRIDLQDTLVSNSDIAVLCTACDEIESLDISYCSAIDGGALMQIADNLKSLRSLWLSFNALTDNTVIYLAERCLELEYLDLYATDVGDAGVEAVAEHCKNLGLIDLTSCEQLTNIGIQALIDGIKGVGIVHKNVMPLEEAEGNIGNTLRFQRYMRQYLHNTGTGV